jgi:hypothetical protein
VGEAETARGVERAGGVHGDSVWVTVR